MKIPSTVYNGFWIPSNTGYLGGSLPVLGRLPIFNKYRKVDNITMFKWFGREYGLGRWAKGLEGYNDKALDFLDQYYVRRSCTIEIGKCRGKTTSTCQILSYYQQLEGSTPVNKYSYNIRIGDPRFTLSLVKRGILYVESHPRHGQPDPANIGFCQTDQKWYGWSHLAIYGFGIGSVVKIGDCGYRAKGPTEYIENNFMFYNMPVNTAYNLLEDGVGFTYIDKQGIMQSKDFPIYYGRGEWEALDLDDAKQMAIDFAHCVN